MWGQTWSVADTNSDTLLEKTGFPLSSRYWLHTASLEVGLWIQLPCSVLELCLAWTCAGPVRAVTASPSAHVCLVRVWRHCFLEGIHHLRFLQLFWAHVCTDPWTLRGVFDKDISWKTVSHSLSIVQLWVPVEIIIHWKKFLWRRLSNTLPFVCALCVPPSLHSTCPEKMWGFLSHLVNRHCDFSLAKLFSDLHCCQQAKPTSSPKITKMDTEDMWFENHRDCRGLMSMD